jgi:hypothetical protein
MYYNIDNLDVDLDKRTLTLKAHDMAICRKNGKGYFIPVGTVAGIWSYYVQDKSLEATQIKCQGRGDDLCEVYAGPKDKLSNKDLIAISNFEVPLESSNYKTFNKPTDIREPSLKSMINQYYFNYDSGLLQIWNKRFFPFEIGYPYLIEQKAKQLGISDNLFEVSKNFYKSLMDSEKIEKPLQFISSFLKATGWGNVILITKKKLSIECTNFPWTSLYGTEDDFPIFRGAISGLISGFRKKDVVFEITKKR